MTESEIIIMVIDVMGLRAGVGTIRRLAHGAMYDHLPLGSFCSRPSITRVRRIMKSYEKGGGRPGVAEIRRLCNPQMHRIVCSDDSTPEIEHGRIAAGMV